MKRESRLGDSMPNRRNVKWGEMRAGESYLSEEWHEMHPSEEILSGKWDEQHPSSPRMSEKWVDMSRGESELSDKWHSMEQEGRKDPYSMSPSEGDRTQGFKNMPKEKPETRVGRSSQHNEFGKSREI